jgi:hypothetical protein
VADNEAKRIGRCTDYSVKVYPAPDPVIPTPEPVEIYSKGWPGDPNATVEPNVAFQLLLDEESGDLLEQVTGKYVAMFNDRAGGIGPEYKVESYGENWSNYTYGKLGRGFPAEGCWDSSDADILAATSLDGASDFVLEVVYDARFGYNPAAGIDYIIGTLNTAVINDGGWRIGIRKMANNSVFTSPNHEITLNFYSLGGGTFITSWRFDTSVELANVLCSQKHELRKIRVVYKSSAQTCELFLNGVSYGTRSVTGMNAKTFPTQRFCFIGFYNGTKTASLASLYTPIYTIRLTKGNSTNNFGGPNGG